jgi:hypothetical protein
LRQDHRSRQDRAGKSRREPEKRASVRHSVAPLYSFMALPSAPGILGNPTAADQEIIGDCARLRYLPPVRKDAMP